MTASKQNTLPASGSFLTILRKIDRKPADSIESMQRIAEAQASVLREALLGPICQLPDYLPNMLPSITVEYVGTLPVAGLSYWGEHRWHIHIRKDDPAEERAFTALYHLKRIIDHPLRRQTSRFTETDWDALARYFAERVLAPSRRLIPT
ncbi:hypothetical protein LUW76_06435 [Actinomadura madurae]|uniref:hypothetical protein n=1 Tax=Actinomadura madurae TaxID=1993 RepID=UPI0020262394|nr:hypothetical protein [Actinomadura madurae]URM93994.1 hypothetical protein LUW76_06435 [Actinomadura madurae]